MTPKKEEDSYVEKCPFTVGLRGLAGRRNASAHLDAGVFVLFGHEAVQDTALLKALHVSALG